METTLLLNTSYEPIHIISWQRAITLLTMKKVEVLETYDREVRSVSFVIRLPAVIRLMRYVGLRVRPVAFSRRAVYIRDDHTCQYCGQVISPEESTLDHVVPRRLGGKSNWTNVVTACAPCNRRKGGRLPHDASMKLLKKPIAPSWLPVLTLTHRASPKHELWAPYLCG